VSILSPVTGTSYQVSSVTAGDILTLQLCDISEDEILTITTSDLPEGVTFIGNTLQGKLNVEGTYTISIAAATVNHGFASITVTLRSSTVLFSASGTITDSVTSVPLEGVLVSAAGGKYTGMTDARGNYKLIKCLISGSYNLIAYKQNYSFAPAIQSVNIANGDVTGVNFSSSGPFRSVSGTVRSVGNQPTPNVLISNGVNSVATNTLGEYTLLIAPYTSSIITPAGTNLGFTPSYASIIAGNVPVIDVNFTSFAGRPPSSPTIIKTNSPGLVFVGYDVPLDDGGISITRYEYSLNNSSTWLKSLYINFEAQYIIVHGLSAGETYSIRIRAVNSAGAGDPSNSVSFIVAVP
jgi:hypothetical protein